MKSGQECPHSLSVSQDLVVVSYEKVLWFDGGVRVTKRHDGDAFAFFDEVGGATVDENFSGSRRAFEDVGFQAGAGSDGGDENFFARPEIGGVHEVAGNFNAALVLDIGLGDDGAVELGF